MPREAPPEKPIDWLPHPRAKPPASMAKPQSPAWKPWEQKRPSSATSTPYPKTGWKRKSPPPMKRASGEDQEADVDDHRAVGAVGRVLGLLPAEGAAAEEDPGHETSARAGRATASTAAIAEQARILRTGAG